MFLSCGDALFDLFVQPSAAPGSLALNGQVGGSTLNVALGLARLGQGSAYLCKNSADSLGERIVQFLEGNAVSTDWILRTSRNSTLAMVETNASGSPDYTFYTENTADLSITEDDLPTSLPDDIGVVHVGSYSSCTDPTGASLLAFVEREQATRLITFDPNIRASIQPDLDVWRDRFSQYAATAGFIKASDEDIEILFGAGTSFERFASDTLALGPALVVVTSGEGGATVYSRDGASASARGVKVDVVDTVGAGDTFQASSLHWLASNGIIADGEIDLSAVDAVDGGLQALVDFATTAAALTCSRRGADLPTLAELDAFRQVATR